MMIVISGTTFHYYTVTKWDFKNELSIVVPESPSNPQPFSTKKLVLEIYRNFIQIHGNS